MKRSVMIFFGFYSVEKQSDSYKFLEASNDLLLAIQVFP